MNRFSLLLLLLALAQSTSFAAVYKCEQDGKIGYQASPCANGGELSSKLSPPVTARSSTGIGASKERKCVGKELRINFRDVPLKTALNLLADFSGYKLVADPSISESAAFSYDCVAWDTVLQDIAARHKLVVKIENGTIFARKQ